jgi:hypothetical protein
MLVDAKLLFHKCVQDSQDYGSDNEHMVSRVFFSLVVPDKRYDDLYADVKQSVGANFESDYLEVSRPKEQKPPLPFEAFRSSVETYYRKLVGSSASGIRIQGGSNIRMRNNTFNIPMEANITIDIESGGW